ncbi:hypothetical protein [Pontimicrobium sp. IMCC45349]|uniref:hypothetical protein n=1 Tax=Pontimicrobium sp. IMCC45349 TaxID=3391574 RepID=UPI0039A3F38E
MLKELRFKIGEQYELNEFNLESLESTFINGLEYESYEYIKNDFKALFGVEFSKNIILQYNADILSRVVYEFDIAKLNIVKDKLNQFNCKKLKLELIKNNDRCNLLVSKKE